MKIRIAAFAAVLAACPGARAQEEVPFITTPDHVTVAMLEMAKVGPQDYVIDLGSGDGRIVITAARRFGARGLGVEIVPELVEKSDEMRVPRRTFARDARELGRRDADRRCRLSRAVDRHPYPRSFRCEASLRAKP